MRRREKTPLRSTCRGRPAPRSGCRVLEWGPFDKTGVLRHETFSLLNISSPTLPHLPAAPPDNCRRRCRSGHQLVGRAADLPCCSRIAIASGMLAEPFPKPRQALRPMKRLPNHAPLPPYVKHRLTIASRNSRPGLLGFSPVLINCCLMRAHRGDQASPSFSRCVEFAPGPFGRCALE